MSRPLKQRLTLFIFIILLFVLATSAAFSILNYLALIAVVVAGSIFVAGTDHIRKED